MRHLTVWAVKLVLKVALEEIIKRLISLMKVIFLPAGASDSRERSCRDSKAPKDKSGSLHLGTIQTVRPCTDQVQTRYRPGTYQVKTRLACLRLQGDIRTHVSLLVFCILHCPAFGIWSFYGLDRPASLLSCEVPHTGTCNTSSGTYAQCGSEGGGFKLANKNW